LNIDYIVPTTNPIYFTKLLHHITSKDCSAILFVSLFSDLLFRGWRSLEWKCLCGNRKRKY